MPDKLPEGWAQTTLGEVCAMNPRTSYDELQPDNTEVSFVPMAAVEEESGRLDASDVRTLAATRKGYTPFKENDVVFAKITPCMENGKVALATGLKNGLGYGSTEFFVFRPYKGLLPRYVLHFLLQPSFRNEARRKMTGAVGQKRVPSNYLLAHPFPLPPTSEQERIVAKVDALLSRITAGRAAARRALERLNRYRTAVLHAAVTGELTREWRKTHQPEESSQQLLDRLLQERVTRWEAAELKRLHAIGKSPKDDEWKRRYSEPVKADITNHTTLAEGWTVMTLDQLTIRLTSGSRAWSKYYDRGNGTFLMAQNIRSTGLDLSYRQVVGPPAKDRDRERSQVAKDDILVTIVGANTGDVCMVPRDLPEHFVCQSVALLRLADPSLSRFVWFYLAAAEDGQKQWRKMIYGAGRPHLSFEHLRITTVPVPPNAEKDEILREVERRLSASDQLVAAIQRQLARANAMHESVLQEAFAGKLVTQNLGDERASVLLDRIRVIRKDEAEKPKSKRMPKPKSDISHRPLLDVLREHKKPMSSEALFRSSGYADLFSKSDEPQDIVDSFYKELRELTENPAKVVQIKDSKNQITLKALP